VNALFIKNIAPITDTVKEIKVPRKFPESTENAKVRKVGR
jgi:hypothetical protein